MNKVHKTELKSLQVFFPTLIITTLTIEVEDVESSERGDPITKFPSTVYKGVRERRQETKGGANSDQTSCEVLVGEVANAVVREGRREGLEREDGPSGEKVSQIGCTG